MSDQAENTQAEDGKTDSNNVWSRGGEGPHAFVEPEHHSGSGPALDTAGSASGEDGVAIAAVLTADDKVVQSVFAVAPPAPPAPPASSGPEAGAQAAEADEAAAKSSVKAEEEKKKPEGPKPINQNDVAIGYAILLAVFGVGYLSNVLFGGTCFISDRYNAICALIFFCIPAFCAACLLSGDKDLRLKGVFAAVPALMIALWGCWYYHIFDQIKNNVGPYGDRVSSSHENGWDICRYDCNWDYGNQTASTMTRERPAGPGLRFVRRMSFGELP